MQPPDLVEPFVSRLERLAVPYMVTGSTAGIRDIRSMLDVSGDAIDRSELDAIVERRGLHKEWALVGA